MSSSRRSGRTSHPTPAALAHSNSGGSSSSFGRAERHTRSKPHKSSTPHSFSSDEIEDSVAAGGPIATVGVAGVVGLEPRRSSRRGQASRGGAGGDDDDDDGKPDDDDADDDQGDEEETTRCICGFQEYQGPPEASGAAASAAVAGSAAAAGHGIAVSSRQGKSSNNADAQADDAGSLFIQCDMCKVWQHGGCVGIMDEAMSPENYFCEQCRKDLHKLMTSTTGQKYSRYLPVYEQIHAKAATRKASTAKEADPKVVREKQKAARPATTDSFTKRRSTMNSRAALEEEEMMRKAIEESKADGGAPSVSTVGRKSKRSRDESEDGKPDIKRQRTQSDSPASTPEPQVDSGAESETEGGRSRSNTLNGSSKKPPRGVAAKNQREKDQREKLQRDEAAKGRNGRLKRGEGKPTSAGAQYRDIYLMVSPADPERDAAELELPKPTPASSQPPEGSSLPSPDTPPATASSSNTTTHHQKKASVQQDIKTKVKGKKGRIQSARDAPAPPINVGSPKRPNTNGNDTASSPRPNGVENGQRSGDNSTAGSTAGTVTKAKKQTRFDKTSWNDMRRMLNFMQEYISRWEIEVATPYNQTLNEALMAQGIQPKGVGDAYISPEEFDELDRVFDDYRAGQGMEKILVDRFKKLNTVQMRIILTRRLQKLKEEHPQFE